MPVRSISNADGGYLLGNLRGEAGSQYNYGGKLAIAGGLDGKLLLPEYTDWSTGDTGLQSILDNLPICLLPEPTPEAPVSLRQFFADNYSWLEPQLGFGAGDIEDIQITSVAQFTDFVRTVLGPLVKYNPSDADGALVLDADMTAVPNVPPPNRYAFPDGYEPADMAAFDRSMTFVLTALGGVQNPAGLGRGSRTTVGREHPARHEAFRYAVDRGQAGIGSGDRYFEPAGADRRGRVQRYAGHVVQQPQRLSDRRRRYRLRAEGSGAAGR